MLNFILHKICTLNQINETSRVRMCLNKTCHDCRDVSRNVSQKIWISRTIQCNTSHQLSTRIPLIKSPHARDRVLTPTKITLFLLLLLLSSIQQILSSFCYCCWEPVADIWRHMRNSIQFQQNNSDILSLISHYLIYFTLSSPSY